MSSPWKDLILATNQTSRPYPREASVYALFAEHARRAPGAIAVRQGDRSITYGELDGKATALARKMGVGPGDVVGLYFDRGLEMILGMLASLAAGAAYLPLDPAYPTERNEFMLRDAASKLVLANVAWSGAEPPAEFWRLDEMFDGLSTAQQTMEESSRSTDTAYVMYTSGSTGAPKGVQVTHRGVVRLVCNTNYLAPAVNDVVAQVSHPCFDAVTFEVWTALLNGAQLDVLPREVVLSPASLKRAVRSRGVTIMLLTTPLFNIVASAEPDGLKTLKSILIGGDALDPRAVRKVQQAGAPQSMVNAYGPTECAVISLADEIGPVSETQASIPIGLPIANSTAYVLNDAMEIAECGELGELYLGGDGLANGYLGQPELTRERFIEHALGRLYRSGDLARYLPDGRVDFGGRKDNQIKISGFRIELGSIEAAIRTYAGVGEVCVILVQPAGGAKKIHAHVSVEAGAAVTEVELQKYLAERLPVHEVPSMVLFHEALPLNGPGKVHRAILLEKSLERLSGEKGSGPAADETQRAVLGIWQNVLGIQVDDLDANFFDLGGSSLLLAQVEALLRERMNAAVPVLELFEHTTVRSLAKRIEKNAPEMAASHAIQSRAQAQRAALERMRRPVAPRGRGVQ